MLVDEGMFDGIEGLFYGLGDVSDLCVFPGESTVLGTRAYTCMMFSLAFTTTVSGGAL